MCALSRVNTHAAGIAVGAYLSGRANPAIHLDDYPGRCTCPRWPASQRIAVSLEDPTVQPGGQPNMQQIMEQAQKMQQQLMAAQQELTDAEVTGTAGGGLVTAVVSGAGELKSINIDPKAADPEDTETLADMVVAAVRDANRAAQDLQAEKMGPVTGALGGGGLGMGGLGLPGM